MLKKFTFLLFFPVLTLNAQYKSVQYNYEKNWLGENQPLPAESQWMLNGSMPASIDMVEMELFGSNDLDKKPLFSSDYRSASGFQERTFSIPVNYMLRGNKEYTIRINYFRPAAPAEIEQLKVMIGEAVSSYLIMSVRSDRNSISLSKHPRLMRQELDQIVVKVLELYRNRTGIDFPGFSDLIYNKLQQIDDLSLGKARFNILGSKDTNEQDLKVAFFQQNLEELKQMCMQEINQYLGFEFLVLADSRVIPNYPTEKTRTTLPINFGYGGVYNTGGFEDLSYDSAPYAGVSFPLGNPALNSKFRSNSSISAGIFINNFDFGDDEEITGPLIGRPIYLAYGYKTAYFLRLNAGMTLLQDENSNDNSKIYIRPFVGLSVELNLWLGLSR
ncbi:MAG: hypothetical protein V2I46_05030 [Bacteroides sp.]|jgi:hypothetical protein|nr:hypothetical protein [Bacteroides sp.]